MAFSINQVYLVGNVASDVELRYTPNGNPVANFSLATNRSIKKNEQWEDVPTFHKIVVWGKTAEYIAQNVSKGNKIIVTGRIENSSYEKDGTKFYKSEIVAQDVIPMSGPRKNAGTKDNDEPIRDNSDNEPNLSTIDDIPDDLGESKKENKDGVAEDIPF